MRRRILGVVGAGIGLLFLVLVLLITSPPIVGSVIAPVRAWLVQTAAQRLSSGMNGTLELGALEGSLLRAPRFSGVVVRDHTGAAVIRIDAVRLHYAPLSLLRGRLVIHEIEVIRPFMTVLQARDGTLNLAGLAYPNPQPADSHSAQSGSWQLPVDIELRRLRVKDGLSRLAIASVKGVTAISNVQITLTGRADDTGLHLTIQEFAAQTHPAQVNLTGLQGTVHATASQLRIDQLQLQTRNTRADFKLILPRGAEPVQLTARLYPLDVDEVGRLLANDTLRGKLRVNLHAQGPLSDIGFRADLSADAGQVRLEGRLNSAERPARYGGRVSVQGFNLAALANREVLKSDLNMVLDVEGRGLSPRTIEGQLNVSVEPSHLGDITLDASRIRIVAQSERIRVEVFELVSSLATISATGSLDFRGASDLVYEARADLSQLQALLGVESLRGSLHLQGTAEGMWPDLDTEGSLTAADVLLGGNGFRLLNLDYQASQLGTVPRASARLQLRDLVVGELPIETAELRANYEGSVRQAAFTAQLRHPPELEGMLAGSLTLGGTVLHAVLDTAELRFGDRTWHAPEPVDMAVGSGTFEIRSFRLTHGEESVSLTGRIENKSLHSVRLEASSIDLTFLKSRLGLPHPVSGRASFIMEAGGPFSEPVLRSELRISPLTVDELPFDRFQATLRYQSKKLTGQMSIRQDEREVVQSEFQMPVNMALADLPLSKRLLDGPLNLALGVRSPDLSLLRAVVPAPVLSGTLHGDVSVHGTYAQLKLASEIDLQNVGVEGVFEEIFAPIRMSAELKTADSVPRLAETLASDALVLSLRRLELHVTSAKGRLPSSGPDQISRVIGIANARLQADAAWNADGFEATIASLQAETNAFNLPATAVSASAQLSESRLVLRHLKLATLESRMEASGSMTLADRRFELEMEIPRLIPGEFGAVLPPSFSGDVRGRARLDGSFSELALAADLRYGEADVQIEGSVDFRNPAYSAEITLRELAIDGLLPVGTGKLNANLSLQGSGFAAPDRKAELHLSFNSREFDLLPNIQGDVRAALMGSAVILDEFRIDSVPLQLTAAGSLFGNQEPQVDYRVNFKDLAPLGPQPGQPNLASGSLTGSIGGAPEALRANGELRLETWVYGDFRGEEATVVFEGEDLMSSPRATLAATFDDVQGGALPAGSVTFDGMYEDRLAHIDVAVIDGPYQETRISGRVALLEDQEINLDILHLQYRHWNWENPGPVWIIRQADGAILLEDFHLRYGEQTIKAHGSLYPSGPLAASIQVHQVEIEPWLATFLPTVTASGRMSLELELTGRMGSPEAAGVLQLRDLTWKGVPIGRIQVVTSFRDSRLDNHLRWNDGDRDILDIKGTLGLGKGYPLDLKAQSSSLDLARLAPVFDVVEQSGGSLDLQLVVGGTVAAPDLRGDLAIREGALQLTSTGEPYQDIEAKLTLRGNRLEMRSLTAASSTGTLRAGGWLETDELRLKHLHLSLQAHDFRVMNTNTVQARLTGALEARGSLDALTVKGDVTVPRARIRLDDFGAGPVSVSPDDLTVAGVYAGNPEEEAGAVESKEPEPDSPIVRGLRTELSVMLPRNAWVVGPETAVEIQGTLLVNKSSNEPFVLGGSAQTVRGHVTYRGRKFDLDRGRITFSGADRNRPILDVLARHEVSDYTITLHVEGDSRRPELTFSSSPDLPEEDILSLLAFGKTIDRLSGSERTALSSQGAAIAGNIISGILEKRLGDTLGLDTLEVEVGDELGTGSVRGGRYVTQDLFLSYERHLGGQSGNTVEVEYSLGPRVKLKGASDNKGQSSLDLFWHIEY